MFCYVHEATFGMSLCCLRIVLVAKGDNPVFVGLELSLPPLDLLGGERGPMAKDLVNHACVMKSCNKNPGQCLESFQVGGDVGRGWRWERAWAPHTLSPYLALCISFICFFLVYIINQQSSK